MRRIVVLAAVVLALVPGCGGDTSSPDGPDTSGTSVDDAATAPDDVCGAVAASDVGAAMGATVTAEAVPGGGCSYEQDDPRATSVSVSTVPTSDANGGFEGAVTGARAVLTDVQETPVSGVGDEAVVLSGTFTGMGSQVTTGIVDLGGFAVLVQVLGGDPATHGDLAQSVMGVAADALG